VAAGSCTGRVVVITGAGNGIGRAHALAFAANADGLGNRKPAG
jgi:NAD(P)-dependent dehydrogenase (short-subunit alcohol dehydrogenase family)